MSAPIVLSQLIVLFISSVSGAETHSNKQILFGTELYVESSDSKTASALSKYLQENTERYQSSFDPDCFYKDVGNKGCGKSEPSVEVFKQVGEFAKETNGTFKLETKKNVDPKNLKLTKQMRDFGGVAEGFVLDELADKFATNWSANFSGDIYIAPQTQISKPYFISDPQLPNIPFARIEMQEGWSIGSSSPLAGGRVHDQAIKKFDFSRVILFARPEFSGARLNAWSVALASGGKVLLRHLLTLNEFKGQWASKPVPSVRLRKALLFNWVQSENTPVLRQLCLNATKPAKKPAAETEFAFSF